MSLPLLAPLVGLLQEAQREVLRMLLLLVAVGRQLPQRRRGEDLPSVLVVDLLALPPRRRLLAELQQVVVAGTRPVLPRLILDHQGRVLPVPTLNRRTVRLWPEDEPVVHLAQVVLLLHHRLVQMPPPVLLPVGRMLVRLTLPVWVRPRDYATTMGRRRTTLHCLDAAAVATVPDRASWPPYPLVREACREM